jgi:hypothetical protein
MNRFETEFRLKASIEKSTAELIQASMTNDEERALLLAGRTGTSGKDVLILRWDPSCPLPVLEDGQHRRAALLKLLNLTPNITHSAADIVKVRIYII